MNLVYRKKNYNLYGYGNNEFIIHNTEGEFSNNHTHIRNYNTAKYLINLSFHRSLPKRHISDYLLESLIRISIDEEYINKLKTLRKSRR